LIKVGCVVLSGILSFWKSASIKRKRVYSLLFIFLLSVVVTFAGTLVPLSDETAHMLSDSVNQIVEKNDTLASLSVAIFVNNFLLCLPMFIPVFGTLFGMFVLFSTGMGINALSMVQGIPASIAFLSLMITPIFWIEFASYSLGMTESIWSFRRFTQRRWAYLAWTAIFIGITAVLLAIGAVVEAWLILDVGV
jgi:hypothetical protein